MRISDWSSDVCSSDLAPVEKICQAFDFPGLAPAARQDALKHVPGDPAVQQGIDERLTDSAATDDAHPRAVLCVHGRSYGLVPVPAMRRSRGRTHGAVLSRA